MTVQDSDTLKSYFNLSKVPTPSNYADLIDTIFEKSIVGNISTEHVNITNTAVQLKDGDTVYTELAGGSLTLGLLDEHHILVASSGIQLKEDTVIKIDLQADGDVFIGEDVSAAATTFMSIFVNAQIYNEELISAGDVLIGDNSPSRANILWDKSEGLLLFRGGTSEQVRIDTDGALSAAGGVAKINSTGISVLSEGIGAGGQEYRYKIVNGIGTMISMYAYEASSGVPWSGYILADGDLQSHQVDLILQANRGNIEIRPDTYTSCHTWIFSHLFMVGNVYINDLENSKSSIGLTINQSNNDDEIISLKSSDISHGMTGITETDTFGLLRKVAGDDGGLLVHGLADTGNYGLFLAGTAAGEDTTKTTSSLGSIILRAAKPSGTIEQGLASNGNIVAIRNMSTTLHIFDADGDIWYYGALQSYKNSTVYTGYIFVPLTTQLTSTSWDGDSFSTTAKTLIDLSAVFGVPAGVKAVLFSIAIRDSASSGLDDHYLILSPDGTAGTGVWIDCQGLSDDAWERGQMIVPCDANGDVYYQIAASGSNTMDIWLTIWGYWI